MVIRRPVLVEVVEIQPERSVLLEINHLVENEVDVSGSAVRSEAHELVFAAVDPESAVVGKRGVKQAQRVWKVDLPLGDQPVALAEPDRRGRPLADCIETEDSCFWNGLGKMLEPVR